MPLEPSTAEFISEEAQSVGSNFRNFEAKRFIYQTVRDYDYVVSASVALQAAYLVDAVSAVDADVWRKSRRSVPHGDGCVCASSLKSFELACLRMAQKYDNQMYETALYEDHMSGCRALTLNDMERELLLALLPPLVRQDERAIPFAIRCPHAIVDEYAPRLAQLHAGDCSTRAHAMVASAVCATSVLFAYLSGSIALAAMYCAATAAVHDEAKKKKRTAAAAAATATLKADLARFRDALAPAGYDHNHTIEQAASCCDVLLTAATTTAWSETCEPCSSSSGDGGTSTTTPPSLKRTRSDAPPSPVLSAVVAWTAECLATERRRCLPDDDDDGGVAGNR